MKEQPQTQETTFPESLIHPTNKFHIVRNAGLIAAMAQITFENPYVTAGAGLFTLGLGALALGEVSNN